MIYDVVWAEDDTIVFETVDETAFFSTRGKYLRAKMDAMELKIDDIESLKPFRTPSGAVCLPTMRL